jgi:hypothetical protein
MLSLVFIRCGISIRITMADAMRGIWLVTGAILLERVFIWVVGLLGLSWVNWERDMFGLDSTKVQRNCCGTNRGNALEIGNVHAKDSRSFHLRGQGAQPEVAEANMPPRFSRLNVFASDSSCRLSLAGRGTRWARRH